jgi:hypothetical protein
MADRAKARQSGIPDFESWSWLRGGQTNNAKVDAQGGAYYDVTVAGADCL